MRRGRAVGVKTARILWALGATSAFGAGVLAVACASSSTTTGGADSGQGSGTGSGTGTAAGSATGSGTGFTPGSGSGTGTTPSSGTGTGAGPTDGGATDASATDAAATDARPGTGSGSGTATGSGSGSGCFKPPVALHAEVEAGVYCPFSWTTDGGKAKFCTGGQHCCEPASGTATCASSCPTADTDWQCQGPLDCAGSSAGHVCCGTGTIKTQAACGAFPAFPYVSLFKGTACATACASSYVVCSRDSECPGGGAGSCVAVEPKGGGMGYCAGTVTDAGAGDAGSHDAGNACVAAGGACVGLAPGSCPSPGHVGSATTYSCGTGLGVECCLP